MVHFANTSMLSSLFFGNVWFLLLFHKPAWNGYIEEECVDLERKTICHNYDCLPGFPWLSDASHDEKLLFIFLSWTTLTSTEWVFHWSQLHLMDYVKYAEDVWETAMFCLTWTILEINPIQADRQSDDIADTQKLTTAMNQGRRVHLNHR